MGKEGNNLLLAGGQRLHFKRLRRGRSGIRISSNKNRVSGMVVHEMLARQVFVAQSNEFSDVPLALLLLSIKLDQSRDKMSNDLVSLVDVPGEGNRRHLVF